MNLWMLFQNAGYEQFFFGVYATKLDAEAAQAAWNESHSYEERWVLIEAEVGAAARFYGWDDWDENRDDEPEGNR
jgi:hypothetical protein